MWSTSLSGDKNMSVGQSAHSTRNFDEIAMAEYDESIPEHVMRHLTARRVAVIRQAQQSGRILDVGCGTGRLLSHLPKQQYQRHGIDISAGMVRTALSKDPDFRCSRASATAIPYPDNTFDIVFSAAVLHHLAAAEAVKQAIIEMIRVTKPGGTAIIWDHNPLNPYWPIIMRRVPQDIGEERLIPRREIQLALETLPPACIADIHWRQMTFVPDFAPAWSMFFFGVLEQILEQATLIKYVSAHNVAIVFKRSQEDSHVGR
jgi:SAM-dependent methyltransferase